MENGKGHHLSNPSKTFENSKFTLLNFEINYFTKVFENHFEPCDFGENVSLTSTRWKYRVHRISLKSDVFCRIIIFLMKIQNYYNVKKIKKKLHKEFWELHNEMWVAFVLNKHYTEFR